MKRGATAFTRFSAFLGGAEEGVWGDWGGENPNLLLRGQVAMIY